MDLGGSIRYLGQSTNGKRWLYGFFTRWRRRLNHRSYGMINEVKRAALQQPQEIDARAIQSFILTLDEDHEIERLVAGIPGFCRSEAMEDPSEVLMGWGISATELGDMILGFMGRSLSSDMILEDVAIRRSALCVKAFEVGSLIPSWITLVQYQISEIYSNPKWINFGVVASILADNGNNKAVANEAHYIIARFTASIGRADERWFPGMMRQFGVTEDTLRWYISHGDSLLLANLLYFVRHRLFVSQHSIWRLSLKSVAGDKLVVMEGTLPELQQQFCEVWNDVVDLTKRQFGDSSESDDRRRSSIEALDFMRDLFISLHPELSFPFDIRRTRPFGTVELPDTLPALPSCPDPACHTARIQHPDTHDRQSHPSHDNPPSSSASNATSPPFDEGTTDAHGIPCAEPTAPSVSSSSTPHESSATPPIGPASPDSGAPVMDASTPSHVSDNAAEPSRSSSPVASSTVQHAELSTTSLVHASQGPAGLAGSLNPSP
ncbi:hypothetical protein BC834DRAFT_503400 [Gloeopeniophorella convolvens]|nr:hypothetical protein BC834DRAFT_503400 [Gloeopeniophorella convolvens]